MKINAAIKVSVARNHDGFGDRNQQEGMLLAVQPANLGNFLRRLALPPKVRHWSLTTLREKLIKIGAKVELVPRNWARV